MNKPEILKGEVKEFNDEVRNYGYSRGDIYRREMVDKFYSQPFKPEMINEYFEGWELLKHSDYCEYCLKGEDYSELINSNKDAIHFYSDSYCYFFGKDEIETRIKTLSQFITNCIQAGIKLEWRLKK